MVKWNWRKSRIIFPRENEHLVILALFTLKRAMSLRGPISASLSTDNTAPFEEMSQRLRAIDNTVFALTGPRFEPLTYSSGDERVTARPPGWYLRT